jgi:hypothetical protein
MDPSERQPRDSLNPFKPLHVYADDALQARRRHPTRTSRTHRRIGATLIFIVAGGYLLIHFSDLLYSAARQVTTPHAPAARLSAKSVPVPPIYTRDALIAPKPLAECIKPDNIIDEAVATCRYGQFPRAVEVPNAQGMVSESYMAKYKSEPLSPRTKRVTAYNVERATVWQWDGKRTYAAEWTINHNRIDDSSVCANYRRGSIEYRECRKGAKVYFREKCREWGKRRAKDGSDASQAIEERFCSAGEGSNPLG